VSNHTTFGFVPQGYLGQHQFELMEARQLSAHKTGLAEAEEWFQAQLEAEATRELGGHRAPRSGVSETWQCSRCERSQRALFRRNGHYRRRLLVAEGSITVLVPLVRCRCGGSVRVKWRVLAERGRLWFDVRLRMIRHYVAGLSYRKTADALSSQAMVHVSHMTVWRAMQKAGIVGRKLPVIAKCPETVVLDEMYVWVAGKKKPMLLAMDTEGRILGYSGPTTRSTDEWRKLLEELSERKVSPDDGLKHVVADGDASIREAVQMVWGKAKLQECIWHILVGVREQARKVHGDSSPLVGQIVQDAREVLVHDTRTAETRKRAAENLAAFVKKHEGRPWVNTVARVFARATLYLESPGLPRTNGTAERSIKEIRRRIKVMDGFRSLDGSMNFMTVYVQCYNELRESALQYARLSSIGQP
jgi:transposase-like protein